MQLRPGLSGAARARDGRLHAQELRYSCLHLQVRPGECDAVDEGGEANMFSLAQAMRECSQMVILWEDQCALVVFHGESVIKEWMWGRVQYAPLW